MTDPTPLHITLDPLWADVADEIKRVTDGVLKKLSGLPITTAERANGQVLTIGDAIACVESAIRSSTLIRESWFRHHAPLSFVVPVAPGINVLCQPFEVF